MTQPAKAQEPSMEEILASIRRIIADDDAAKSPPNATELPPSTPRLASAQPPAAIAQPPVPPGSPVLVATGALWRRWLAPCGVRHCSMARSHRSVARAQRRFRAFAGCSMK